MLCFLSSVFETTIMNRHRQPTIRVRRAITQASNVMIESSLLKTRIRLLQCCVSHKTAPFRAPALCGNRSSGVQPISVNRVLVSCSGVIGNSLLLVCHTERRPQSPCSMWEQELNRCPSIVNRQPSTVFKRQPGFQPAIDPELY